RDCRRRQNGRRFAPNRHLRGRFIALRPFRLVALALLGLSEERSANEGEGDEHRRAKKCAARMPRDDHATHRLQISKKGRRSSQPKPPPPKSLRRAPRDLLTPSAA